MVSASAAFLFIILVWYFDAGQALATAAGLGLLMGLVVLASSWFLPRRRRR